MDKIKKVAKIRRRIVHVSVPGGVADPSGSEEEEEDERKASDVKDVNAKRADNSYPGFLLRSSLPPLPNSASLYPHHTPPSLIWIPFPGSVMGLLVCLMHCDLLQLTVYRFMWKIKKKRGGGVSLPFIYLFFSKEKARAE